MNKGIRPQRVHFILYLSSLLVGVSAYHITAMSLKNYRAGDIGLGIATTSHDAYWRDSLQLSHSHGNYIRILPALDTFSSPKVSVVLLTGNSQLHAINQYQEGDHLAVYYAMEALNKESSPLRFVQLSAPNITPLELLVYYLALKQEEKLPDWFVVGMPLRSYQLLTLREVFKKHLAKQDLNTLGVAEDIQAIYHESLLSEEESTTLAKPEHDETPQDQVEDRLIAVLEDVWEPYQYRGNVRSQLHVIPGLIYQKLSGQQQSMTGSTYVVNKNLNIIDELIRLGQEDGVKVLLYQPPHPPQTAEEFGYDRQQYDYLFQQLEVRAGQYPHVYYADFNDIVPLEYWGKTNRGWLDVFHFQNEGHQRLGTHLARTLDSLTQNVDHATHDI